MFYEAGMILSGIWYQFRQIAPYWAVGLIAGSLVSVFLSNKITDKMTRLAGGKFWFMPLCISSFLGIVSPLCMYGTVPVIAALGRNGANAKAGVPQHLLAAFMVSSILLNPNIMLLSFALGNGIALARLGLSFLCGVLAGALVCLLFKNKTLFSFERFSEQQDKPKKNFLYDLFKAFRITSPYLLIGLTLTALFDRYVPPDWVSGMFGARRGLGVLFAASLSIPLYACGGGTIPLINAWLHAGMGTGDALVFMLAGPALKINNLSAVKMILGVKNFFIYMLYCLIFAMLSGLIINVIVEFVIKTG
ncbi:MAG: permease [Treponema sp.]|nr:permease [Treponema sp.]